MEIGEVKLMKYSMDNIDERARKILGFDNDEELEYDEVVDRYLLTLANYAVNVDDETFFTEGVFHNLNCFQYLIIILVIPIFFPLKFPFFFHKILQNFQFLMMYLLELKIEHKTFSFALRPYY